MLLLFWTLLACDDTLFGIPLEGADASQEADAEPSPDDSQPGEEGGSSSGDSAGVQGDEPWCELQRIFSRDCVSCHGGTAPSLEGEDAHEQLIEVASALYAGAVYVIPGDPEGSLLYQKVIGAQGELGSAMPLGSEGLDAEDAQAIYDWIAEGAPTDCGQTLADTGGASRYHPEGWSDPGVHGQGAKHRDEDCQSCHGADLTGGSVGVSCDSCHDAGWREDCTFCHGGVDNSSGAPPRDISNETVALSFLAHTAHVSTRWHAAYDCVQCHTKPLNVLSSGHLFNDDATLGQAEVDFSAGLSPAASWDGSGGCSNLYCHGDGQTSQGRIRHDESPVSCTSCHPDASSGRDAWDEMSGEHEDHLREGATCSMCHGATVGSDQSILDPALHVNGVKDISLTTGMSWRADRSTCTGSCHIGSEEEDHEAESWD